MLVLGIETSCDETGLAVYCTENGILSEALYSQIELHADYGGVVPELASRDHIRKITPLTRQVLRDADCSMEDLDGIAYTAGPGLMGALLVGATYGRTLAWSLGIPAVEVHHMEAHLLAPLLSEENRPELPFLALLVSGGHTQLMRVGALGDYELLGESVDDAAGEAFDKAAKMLELGYPGGPQIARAAINGDPSRFRFPRPMTDRPGLDFSFSGLEDLYPEHRCRPQATDGSGHRRRGSGIRIRCRGYAVHQVPARGRANRRAAPGDGRRGGGQSVVAGKACQRSGRRCVLRAQSPVHRQWCNDRLCGRAAPASGRAGATRGGYPPALADDGTRPHGRRVRLNSVADTIFIRDLTFSAIIGVHEYERTAPQPLRIDLQMEVDVATPARSKQLSDTVDYAQVAAEVEELARQIEPLLIETLAEDIAANLLANPLIHGVKVRIEKPEALPGSAVPGVEIYRAR